MSCRPNYDWIHKCTCDVREVPQRKMENEMHVLLSIHFELFGPYSNRIKMTKKSQEQCDCAIVCVKEEIL